MKKFPDPLSEGAVRAHLPGRLSSLPVFFYPETDSTNTRAKVYAKEHPEETGGAVFLADRQTAGRGRMGRSFLSDPGVGLYITFLFPPRPATEDLLSQTAAAAVYTAEAIAECCPELALSIKWVNDLLIGGKKAAGILAEGILSPDGGSLRLIVGVGINLAKRAFPEELSAIATAIGDYTDPPERARLAAAMIRRFFPEVPPERAEVMRRYRERLSHVGKLVRVLTAKEEYRATLLGVTDEGFLRVLPEDGRERILKSGEISIRF